ncbi:MAG TPA: hypothetical protein VID67_08270 [Rhizomicrobium sp.]
MRISKSLVLALMLAGFLLQPLAASAADDLANVKSVAIISALGDCLNMRDVEPVGTIFNTVHPECVPIESWGIDDLITQQLTTALSGRFAVKPVNYNRAVFYHLPWSPISGAQVPVEKQLRALTNPGVDAYIVVTRMALPNALGDDNNTYVDGLGIGHESSLFSQTTKMFAIYTIRIIDAQTFKTLETEGAHLPKTGFLPRVPIVDVDKSLWSPSARDMTDDQEAKARERLTALVQESIGSTLHYMDLAP